MMNSARAPHYVVVLLLSVLVQVTIWQLFTQPIEGDEIRYLEQSERLLQGESLYKRGRIVNPPLLPMMLAGAQKVGLSIDLLPLLSIAAVSLAALILLRLLSIYLKPWWAVVATVFVVLHPAVLLMGSQLLSEPWSILWSMLMMVFVFMIHQRKVLSWWHVLIAALSMAALAMMKPLFGYTIMAALLFTLLAILILPEHYKTFLKRMGAVCALALVFCVPFLAYTYSETGKIFKWSTGTGVHLYFMSIGGEDVWGSWVPDNQINDHKFLVDNGYADEINNIVHLNYQEKDRILQGIARERISENPQHFIMNVVANSMRVLFNYPYSFRAQSLFTYGYILPNMMLYLPLALSFVFLWFTRHYINPGITWCIAFFLIYLGGNMLVGSNGKQGVMLIGPFLIWLAMQVRILIEIGFFNPDALGASESRFDRRRRS